MHPTVPPPRDLDDAMALLSDPARHRGLPAVIQTNWAFLKEARGQAVHWSRLAPAHLTDAAGPCAPGECWTPYGVVPLPPSARPVPAERHDHDAARARALPKIRAAIAHLIDPTGGHAA